MTLSVAEVQPALHELFNDAADHLARASGFTRRARKLTGAVFAKALVFSLLKRPDATLDDFAEMAEALEAPVTPQAFDERFGPAAAAFLHELFVAAFQRCFASLRPALLPLLRRFNGVYLRDATLVALPPSLAELFPGRGGRHAPHGRAAAVKLVFEAEVGTGALTGCSLLAGLSNEKAAEVAGAPLPEGALLLEDMGFHSGQRLQDYIDQGVYVVARVPAWTAVFGEAGGRIDLVKELRKARGWRYERAVQLMHGRRLRLRLLALRLPEAEAERRRRRVREEARKRGRKASQKRLDMCEWNVLLTNAPRGLLSAEEAGVVRRVRWQVELVFKVFKSEGRIDEWRSGDRRRVLCELYAKLLAMVVQNRALLAAGYVMLRHSARRAARRARGLARKLMKRLGRPRKFARAVVRLAVALHRRCAVVSRRAEPSTLDRLRACDPQFDLLQEVA
jgi:Transposase DDE domain